MSRTLKVKYVEMGNEPDYEADMTYQGQTQFWSVIDNYSSKYLEFAKAIRSKYPDIKFMGPACAQVENHERKEGAPWLAPESAPWWPDRFLEKCGPYVDVVSVHSYPYWSNDSDSNLLSKTNKWAEFIPKIRASIKKHCPDRADQIEISVSEWNSGDENSTTARIVNGVFAADYLAQMIFWGANQTNIWDLMTQKTGLGGGHGVIDPDNDKTKPFAERSHYWALYLMKYHFGTTLFQAVYNNEYLSVYASTGNGRKYLLIINKSPKYAFQTDINLGKTVKGTSKLDLYRLSSKEYQWSENLYRAVINTGPSHLKISQTVNNRFEYTFPPFSITCVEMTLAK
jgi:alpha-L-arabinofuranosidase